MKLTTVNTQPTFTHKLQSETINNLGRVLKAMNMRSFYEDKGNIISNNILNMLTAKKDGKYYGTIRDQNFNPKTIIGHPKGRSQVEIYKQRRKKGFKLEINNENGEIIFYKKGLKSWKKIEKSINSLIEYIIENFNNTEKVQSTMSIININKSLGNKIRKTYKENKGISNLKII